MGNHTTKNSASPSPMTHKGNPLLKFKRVTKGELNTYRVSAYGYLM